MNNFKLTSKREVCGTVLKWFKDKAVLNNNGRRSITIESYADMIYSVAVDELLFWCISIQPSIPEFTKRQVVSRAIDRWLRYKKYRDIPDKIIAYESALLVELKNIPSNENYLVLGFINLRPEDFLSQKPIEINGCTLRFALWPELQNIKLENLWKNAKEYLPKHIAAVFGNPNHMATIYTPVFINVESYSKNDALQKAQYNLNLLRVALNFVSATSLFAKYSEVFPLAKFFESPVWGVIDANMNLSFDDYTENDIKRPQQQVVNQDEYKTAQNIIKKINESDGLWGLITKLLYLYQQALDLTDSLEVYLALWRILEGAVLNSPDHLVNICAMVEKLTEIERNPILKHTLDMLSDYRNDLVHRGTFPEKANNIIFSLKKIVDITLGKMMNIANHVSDENELQEYLNLLSTNDTDLKRKAKIIELLKSKRENKAG